MLIYNVSGNFIKDMLSFFLNIQICFSSYFILAIILVIFTAYAYYINSNRPADDPQKKNYYASGIFIMPFIWPILLVGWIIFVVLRAIHFGFFLVIFTLTIVLKRKPFWLVWLEKIALKIGTKLLDADAALRSFAFGWSSSSA